jgi:membrane protein YqaA with SNARE-associated domain
LRYCKIPTPAFLSVGISATTTNPLLVAFVAALGGAIGEGTTFLFGYTSSKAFNLEKHKSLKRFKKKVFDRWGGIVILFFAFIPNPLFDGIGMVAGISKYPIKRFLFLTFTGRLFRYIVIGYVSSYIALR